MADGLTRRQFLTGGPSVLAGILGGSAALGEALAGFQYLTPIEPGTNPLAEYPNREWEKVYRDLYTPDETYHYMCGPNDTHGCLLKANVKNGVVVYADPSFGYSKCTDVYGNKASARWDPRACISGLSYVRRMYSDRRVKGCFVRKGFKQWVDDGWPRGEDGLPDPKYRLGRGKEEFLKVSLDEAADIWAKTLVNIAETYSGDEGQRRLEEQGYDEAMVEAAHGAGTLTAKFRGGMPFDAPFRIGGMYRMANMLALLDEEVRGLPKEELKGGRHWDSYSWHTDLPPGHPMVSGQQTLDFDLYTAEHANLVTLWGMNWIATKMPDGHWLTEAKLHGTKVVTIAPEYQSSTSKADRAIVIRPGSDGALALGLAHVLMKEELYDVAATKTRTDLPLLIRTDTRKFLRAADAFAGYQNAALSNFTTVITDPAEKPPPAALQSGQRIPAEMRDEWSDFVVWDTNSNSAKAISRDQIGNRFPTDIDPALEGEFDVTLADGTTVTCRPAFDAIKQHVMDSCSPDKISKVTWAPVEAIEALARDIAANKGKTLFVTGMGPNHFFNNDAKDRTIILVAALTDNVGHFGGTVGSYAGNYRLPNFAGFGQYAIEDPFDITLDPDQPAKVQKFYKGESAHYYNYGDRPLRIGNKLFTGSTHMPTPTKSMYFSNGNSLLGNAKGAHDVFINTLPKIEMIALNEWFWTASCEYSDIVFGVDSWVDRKQPDIFASVTNPFLHAWPVSPDSIPRIFDTHDDIEVYAALAGKLAEATGDRRFADYWAFVGENRVDAYIQRVFDASNSTKGYQFADLHESSKDGTPFYMMMRTSPKIVGWEQRQEDTPWYNRTGRLEFYRDEDEFLEHGENLPVHREPVDGTVYEPNAILGVPHPLLQPVGIAEYGLDEADSIHDTEARQVRNVLRDAETLVASEHPLIQNGFTHILITPKYRHACHSMGASTDTDTIIWGPYGDFYRHDKRKPWMSEGYIDLNPDDAREQGIDDGDYVWCDADPSDRPFKGWQDKPDDYHVTRWLVRVRYNPSIVRRVGRAWFHFYVSTHGSVEGHETREDGLAKNPRTNYQAGYRYGSHQSVTRAWLRPTLQTDSLVRKDAAGQGIGKGFELDVHCTVGAPKESFVKLERAEPGGESGEGLWYPAAQGFRPGRENAAMQKFLQGSYISGR